MKSSRKSKVAANDAYLQQKTSSIGSLRSTDEHGAGVGGDDWLPVIYK
jgi:hypothetical protein